METQITKDEANKIMTQRGYESVSHNESGGAITKINYVRSIPVGTVRKVTLYATVNLVKATVDISFIELKRSCQLLTGSLAYDHRDFEQFEQILLVYAAQCTGQNPFDVLNGWLASVPKREETHVDDVWDYQAEPWKQHETIAPEAITDSGWKPIPDEPVAPKKDIKARKREFWDSLAPIAKQRGWTKEQTLKFYNYWTEENKSRKKFRRENENFFDINKRMATFDSRDNAQMGNRKSFADQKAEKQTAALKKVAKVIQTKNVF